MVWPAPWQPARRTAHTREISCEITTPFRVDHFVIKSSQRGDAHHVCAALGDDVGVRFDQQQQRFPHSQLARGVS